MTSPDTPSLRVQGLRVAYDDRVVIDGLDLDIPARQITAIVGPNACGKSTLLRTWPGCSRRAPAGFTWTASRPLPPPEFHP